MKKLLIAIFFCGATIAMSTLLIGPASAGQIPQVCTGKETGEVLHFSPIPGSNQISVGRKVLKIVNGQYKMIGRGRFFHFGKKSLVVTFRNTSKKALHFSC